MPPRKGPYTRRKSRLHLPAQAVTGPPDRPVTSGAPEAGGGPASARFIAPTRPTERVRLCVPTLEYVAIGLGPAFVEELTEYQMLYQALGLRSETIPRSKSSVRSMGALIS